MGLREFCRELCFGIPWFITLVLALIVWGLGMIVAVANVDTETGVIAGCAVAAASLALTTAGMGYLKFIQSETDWVFLKYQASAAANLGIGLYILEVLL